MTFDEVNFSSFYQMPMSTADDANLSQVPSPMGNDGMGWSVVLC